MSDGVRYEIGYGKARIPVYRVYATPLQGITPIPESPFTGRDNTLFAAEIDVEVLGDHFLPAYTEGDNRMVVATDSMKNFVLRESLSFVGATLERLLDHLGRRLIDTYPQLRSLRLTGRELPFAPVPVPSQNGQFVASPVLYDRARGDHAMAVLEIEGDVDGTRVVSHRCGQIGMHLLKVTGSSFTSFVRDGYTTLPERVDRPLFVHLDVLWRYTDVDDLLAAHPSRYVPAEQVRDLVRTVFQEFVSESIQHLVHEMGTRLLDRFPQIAEVQFMAQNRTPDPAAVSETDPKCRVYTDPFSAYGLITLTLRREN